MKGNYCGGCVECVVFGMIGGGFFTLYSEDVSLGKKIRYSGRLGLSRRLVNNLTTILVSHEVVASAFKYCLIPIKNYTAKYQQHDRKKNSQNHNYQPGNEMRRSSEP